MYMSNDYLMINKQCHVNLHCIVGLMGIKEPTQNRNVSVNNLPAKMITTMHPLWTFSLKLRSLYWLMLSQRIKELLAGSGGGEGGRVGEFGRDID